MLSGKEQDQAATEEDRLGPGSVLTGATSMMWCLTEETWVFHQTAKHTPGPGADNIEGGNHGKGAQPQSQVLPGQRGRQHTAVWVTQQCPCSTSLHRNQYGRHFASAFQISQKNVSVAGPNQKHTGKAIICNVIQSRWHTSKPSGICCRKAGPTLWAQVSLQTNSLRNGLHFWPP